MNWPEALSACVALICGTAVVFVLLYLRQQQMQQAKELDRSVQHPAESPEPPAWIAPEPPIAEKLREQGLDVTVIPAWDEAPTEAYDPTSTTMIQPSEAYASPETDVDNLAERLERLERLIDEGG